MCLTGRDKGRLWLFCGKGRSVMLTPPGNWESEGWRYAYGRKWSYRELRENRARTNHQYRLEVKRQQEVELGSSLLKLRVRRVKVEVTRAKRKEGKVGHIWIIAYEFGAKLIEVVVAGCVIWSTCVAFSRNARVTQATKYVE